ncbi:MAG: hypothetical protein ACE5OP_09985 [Candidatus Glassbacteria bacterium]
MTLKPLIKNPPFILAICLIAAFGFLILNNAWDDTPISTERMASVQNVTSDWSNCLIAKVPLELGMEIQNVIENQGGGQERGGLVEVLLNVKPLLESESLSWHLELPGGVKTYSGPESWSGIVGKDQTASFVFTLSVPDGKEYYIDAVGEYEAETGASVRKAVSLEVDLGEPEPPANPSFIRIDEKGRRVVTYRGNTIGGGN